MAARPPRGSHLPAATAEAISVEPASFIPNIHHPEVMRGILEQILATGDVIRADGPGRTVPAVTVDDWLFDELAGIGADLEDMEPEPIESDEG